MTTIFYVFSFIRSYLYILLTSWIFISLLVFSLLRYSLLVTVLLCLVTPIYVIYLSCTVIYLFVFIHLFIMFRCPPSAFAIPFPRSSLGIAWLYSLLTHLLSGQMSCSVIVSQHERTTLQHGTCHDLQFLKPRKYSPVVASVLQFTLPDDPVRVQKHASGSTLYHSSHVRKLSFGRPQGRET